MFKELSDVLGGRPLTLQERVVNGSVDGERVDGGLWEESPYCA